MDAPSTVPAARAGEGASPAIRLVGVSKTFGAGEIAVHALRDISLEIPTGQFVVVLGPSGSGKTTLMNVLGGLEPATSGRVAVAGETLEDLTDAGLTAFRRDRIGFVFQFFNLVPTLTARENVQLVAELVGRSGSDTDAALAAVGLAARADHFPAAMSGGEQQRVAIARAIVKEPSILLCDEPTGSLDLETGRHVLAVLDELCRTGGRTVVLVTHNSAIATIADRVVRMRSGEIVDDLAQARPARPEEIAW